MQNPYDQLAKQIGEEALTPFGTTVVHDEISPETQYADLRPRDRSTLLLRLMAAGQRLDSVIGELRALPPDARERVVAEPILLRLGYALGQEPNPSPVQQEMKMVLYKNFDEIRAEGSAKGLAEGSAKALLIVLQGRGIAVPEAARERILTEKDSARLTRWLERAGVVGSVEDLIDNVR